MWERIENILVNNAAWPYEKDYDDQGFLWDDEFDDHIIFVRPDGTPVYEDGYEEEEDDF